MNVGSMRTSGRLGKLLLIGLAAHLLICVLRIPHAVIGKRTAEVRSYHQRGRVRYLLDSKHHKGAAAVLWLQENTRPESVILWRGEYKGSFELVAELIFPRLLYEESRLSPGTTQIHGRPVSGKVLEGLGNDLRLVGR